MDRDSPSFLVTLGLDPDSFGRLDDLRERFFPPARNVVPAHLMLFHQLPGDEDDAIRAALDDAAGATGPIALGFRGLFRLGGGMAVRVEAEGLARLHARLVRSFSRWLTPQDRQPFRPHVTLMNKAERGEARRAFDQLSATWSPWEGTGDALLLWRYLGGPWEPSGRRPLVGGSA